MKNKHPETNHTPPMDQLIRRLEIIKNYVLLEDEEELVRGVEKLKAYDHINGVNLIVDKIGAKEYAGAMQVIQNFMAQHQQLSAWSDPEISALKLEVKNLEDELNSLTNEKIELEKLLSDFEHRHSVELGDIILEILRLKKQKYRSESDRMKYEEAEQDEKQYRKQVNRQKKKNYISLDEEGQKTLKQKFRKASKICHPDKVSDEFREAAQQIFIELKEAYDLNDLDKVSKILSRLEKGHFFKTKSEMISEKELLRSTIAKLKQQIQDILSEIAFIRESETYVTISTIPDWDEYFAKTKKDLLRELENLRSKVD